MPRERRPRKSRKPTIPTTRATPIHSAWFPKGTPVRVWERGSVFVNLLTGESFEEKPRIVYEGRERRAAERRHPRNDRRMPELSIHSSPFTGRRKNPMRKVQSKKSDELKIPKTIFTKLKAAVIKRIKEYAKLHKLTYNEGRRILVTEMKEKNILPGQKFIHNGKMYVVYFDVLRNKFSWMSTRRVKDRRSYDRRNSTQIIETQSNPEWN